MPSSVALLRGINVGGKNLIRMPALKACFEENGFDDVVTYIQSGNVLFTAPTTQAAELTRRIEAMLAQAFDYVPTVVVRTRRQMRAIVDRAPKGFGREPAKYRYDLIFLKEPLAAKVALQSVPTKPGVDAAHPGTGVLYFEAQREGLTEPPEQDRVVADLPERHDQELEDDDEAAVDDGRAAHLTLPGSRSRPASVISARPASRSPRRGASGRPSSRAPSAAAGRTPTGSSPSR